MKEGVKRREEEKKRGEEKGARWMKRNGEDKNIRSIRGEEV